MSQASSHLRVLSAMPDAVSDGVAESGSTSSLDLAIELQASSLENLVHYVEVASRQAAEVEQLRAALSTRPAIEQAKGMLMAQYGIDAERAFQWLSRRSQQRKIKVQVLARMIVQAHVSEPRHPQADPSAPIVPPIVGADGSTPDRTGRG